MRILCVSDFSLIRKFAGQHGDQIYCMAWITFQSNNEKCINRRPSRRRTPNKGSDNDSVESYDSDTVSSVLSESSDEYEDIESDEYSNMCCLTTSSKKKNSDICLWDIQTGKLMQTVSFERLKNASTPQFSPHLTFCWLSASLLAALTTDGLLYTCTFVWKGNSPR